jgi:hypothetical protein
MSGFAAVLGESGRLSASRVAAALSGAPNSGANQCAPVASVGPRGGVAAAAAEGPYAAVCGEIVKSGGFLRGDEAAAELLNFAGSGRSGLPDGWFAGCVVDPRKQQAYLFTDRLGQQPLYYRRAAGGWLVATELKAFLAAQTAVTLDDDAVATFLSYEQVLGDRTLLDGVQLAPPGSVLTLDLNGRVSVNERWRYRLAPVHTASDADQVAEFRVVLGEAVARSDESAAIALSGGLDSRCLLAVLPDARRATTVTYGALDSHDRNVARRAAESVGTDHLELELEPGWVARGAAETVWRAEGAIRCFHSHHLALTALSARGVDAVQIGFGGDACIRGVTGGARFGELPTNERALVDWLHRRRGFILPDELAADVLTQQFARSMHGRARAALADCLAEEDGDALSRVRQFAVRQEARRKVLPGALLFAQAVVPRDPYGAAEVLDFSTRIPEALRRDARLQRLLLEPSSALSALPSQKQGAPPATSGLSRALLTATVAKRRRVRALFPVPSHRGAGIGDYRLDLRRHGGRELLNILLEERTLSRGQIRREAVRSMIADALTGRRRHTFALGVLLTLELFQRQFVEREAPALVRPVIDRAGAA